MAGTFHLIDLVTQCPRSGACPCGTERRGKDRLAFTAWSVVPIIQSGHHPGAKQAFSFRSAVGKRSGSSSTKAASYSYRLETTQHFVQYRTE